MEGVFEMERKLISVIVPVYNIKEYLPRCVASIQAQTYPELEIILVDDGSDDGTGELCEKLAEKDPRIHVYHKENGGSSSARNLGISRARGDYLGFVDSDDYIEPDMYEKLYEGVCRFGVKVAQIGRDEITPEGEVLPDLCIPPAEPKLISSEDFLYELLMHRGDCSFCTKLIDRTLLEEYSTERVDGVGTYFPLGVLNEDFYLLVKLLEKTGKILSLPGHAYHVFYRIGSNSRKEDKENFSRVFGDCVDNADMVSELVDRQYPELKEVSLRFGVFQRLEYLLHIPISQMTRANRQYRDIIRFLRKNWGRSMKNPVLTMKNKIYHTLFAIAPAGVRKLHRLIMRMKGQ